MNTVYWNISKQNKILMTSCQENLILKLQSSVQKSGGHSIISRRYFEGSTSDWQLFPPHFLLEMECKSVTQTNKSVTAITNQFVEPDGTIVGKVQRTKVSYVTHQKGNSQCVICVIWDSFGIFFRFMFSILYGNRQNK